MPIIELVIRDDYHDNGRTGVYSIEECARTSEFVYRTVMKAMFDQDLIIEGTLFMPNMVTASLFKEN